MPNVGNAAHFAVVAVISAAERLLDEQLSADLTNPTTNFYAGWDHGYLAGICDVMNELTGTDLQPSAIIELVRRGEVDFDSF